MESHNNVRLQIITLYENTSKSTREIASDLGVSQSMLAKVIANYPDRGTHATNYENCGRKKIFDDRDLRSIRNMSIKRPRSTARDIHATLHASGDSCSYTTVKHALIEGGCKAIKP